MDAELFLVVFSLVFVAELGDKTQLAVMALAARQPWKPVFGGAALAFALLNVVAVVAGQAVFRLVPMLWVELAAALLFAAFGVIILMGKEEEEDAPETNQGRRSPFWGAFGLILLAEFGDKTQLATAGVAAQVEGALAVFLASTLALWTVSLIGVFFGKRLFARLPPIWIRWGAGGLFLLFAAGSLFHALT